MKSKKQDTTPQRLTQELVDSIPDAIYFKNSKGQLILVNEAHASGLGLKPEDVVGKTDFKFFPTKQARLMTEDDRQVMQTGIPLIDRLEKTTRPDGSQHYVSTTKLPRRDASGNIVGIMGITRDITDRTKRQEDRYRMLFETSQNCIFITTKDGRWIDVNEAGVKLFGYESKEELLKTKITSIYISPKDRKKYIQEIEKENFVKDYETDLKKRDGSVVKVRINAVVRRDKDGAVIGYQGTILDVTAQKEAEREKERLLERLNERVKELWCLYGIEKIRHKEYNSISDYLKEVVDFIAPGLRYPDLIGCRITLEGKYYSSKNFKKTKWIHKIPIFAHNMETGSIEACYLTKKPVENGNIFSREEQSLINTISERLGSFIEQQLMEEALEALPQRIIQAQESERDRISREIHDDIGQSLATLKMLIQSTVLGEATDKLKSQESLEKIIPYLNTIIEKSRRLAYGLRPPSLEVLGLTNSLRTMIEEFGYKKDLHIKFSHDRLDKFDFEGGAINIYRIIQEALTNAVKHSMATKMEIKLKAKKDRLCIMIRDNGKGFEFLEDKKSRGSLQGLGLSTMEKRTKLLKGEFNVASKIDSGTTISISIPFTKKLRDHGE